MEKKLRLVQVAREFKVGLGTITEFLEKKGIKDVAPNTLVESDVYALLEKEFGGNHLGGERANVRERMNLKQESVSLGDRKESGVEEKEVIIKNSSFIRTEVPTPKVIGKIDLEPAAAPKAEVPAVEPKAQKEVKSEQPAPAPAPKPEVKPEPAPAPKAAPAPAPAPKKEPVVEAPAKQESPVADSEAQTKTYDERLAESKDVFRLDNNNLSGPKVLGKIDVDSFRKGGDSSHREKRKRIKDKVDVTKPQQGGQQKPANGNKPNQPKQQNAAQQQQAQQQGGGKKKKK